MIYDCFIFYNELDLLELRLRLLDEVVDVFVVCEAPFTFRGAPKPLFFAEHASRFARWRERIVPLVYPGPPDPDPWRNEWGQRDFLATALGGCAADDLIIVGDCDELPDPRNVRRRPPPGKILGHLQLLSDGYFNRVAAEPWLGTRTVAAGDLPRFGTLTGVRGYAPAQLETVSGGWHLHALGGAVSQAHGMTVKSHVEFDVPYYRDLRRIAANFASERDTRWIPFDDAFPPLMHEERWASSVWPQPPAGSAERVAGLEHAHGCFAYVPDDAPAVYVVADDADGWTEAGRERFGERFAGVAVSPDAWTARIDADAWVVVDHLERRSWEALRALQRSGAGVVAYCDNACSRDVFEAVAGGAPFPAGRALDPNGMRAWLAELGWSDPLADRIAISGVFAILSQLPQRLSVENGRFRLQHIRRETLSDFLAQAFVFRISPRPR